MEVSSKALEEIHMRNARVERDKAWETSWTRRLFIALMTYAAATLFFWINNIPTPLLQACIPTGGYLLSTLSLPWLKQWWIQRSER